MPAIENHLAERRRQRGLAAAELARRVAVSRQTIYALEAGSYLPNTGVALRLAQALETSVEDLFRWRPAAAPAGKRTAAAAPLPGAPALQPGQAVELCRVDQRLLALEPPRLPWLLPAGDAVVVRWQARRRRAEVRTHGPVLGPRLLLAGCDPGAAVLARHLRAAGVELVLAQRNSTQALRLLQRGCVHVAGSHLRDDASAASAPAALVRGFAPGSVAVFALAVWEEGMVVAAGNPKAIRAIEDLGRRGVTIVNREAGSGCRHLLDAALRRAGMAPRQVGGYRGSAGGHLAAALQVSAGAVDACIATRAVARHCGLGFVALARRRYELVVRRSHLQLPAMQALLETLARPRFRRALESLGGYDAARAGTQLAD